MCLLPRIKRGRITTGLLQAKTLQDSLRIAKVPRIASHREVGIYLANNCKKLFMLYKNYIVALA